MQDFGVEALKQNLEGIPFRMGRNWTVVRLSKAFSSE
jgi:hypothetical protein